MADRTKPGDMDAQIAEIRDEIARLARLLGDRGGANAGPEEPGSPSGRARRGAEEARHRVEDAAVSIERYVTEKPMQSAMIALLAGLVIGLLTRR